MEENGKFWWFPENRMEDVSRIYGITSTNEEHERRANSNVSVTKNNTHVNSKKKSANKNNKHDASKGKLNSNGRKTNKPVHRNKDRQLSITLPSANEEEDDENHDHTDSDSTSEDSTSTKSDDDSQTKTDDGNKTSNKKICGSKEKSGDTASNKVNVNKVLHDEKETDRQDQLTNSKDNDQDSGNVTDVSESEDDETEREDEIPSTATNSTCSPTGTQRHKEEEKSDTVSDSEDTSSESETDVSTDSEMQERRDKQDNHAVGDVDNKTDMTDPGGRDTSESQNNVEHHDNIQHDTDSDTDKHNHTHHEDKLKEPTEKNKNNDNVKSTSITNMEGTRERNKSDIAVNSSSKAKTSQLKQRKQISSNTKRRKPTRRSRIIKHKSSAPKQPVVKQNKEDMQHEHERGDNTPVTMVADYCSDPADTDTSEDGVTETARPKTATTGTQCTSPGMIVEPEVLLDDCIRLREALCGKSVNKDAINGIVARTDLAQRLRIRDMYLDRYGQDIIDDIQCEVRGDYQHLLRALFEDHATLDATLLNYAVKGLGTNEAALIHVLASRSDEQIKNVKARYCELYGHDVADDVKGDTSGSFQIYCLVLLDTGTDDVSGAEFDDHIAEEYARRMWLPGEKLTQEHENTFIEILSTISGIKITDAIKKCSRGDIQDGLLATASYLADCAAYHADVIHKAIKGFRRNDRLLINAIVTRMDTDLQDVNSAYETLYKRSLNSAISSACSGHYAKLLNAIVSHSGQNTQAIDNE